MKTHNNIYGIILLLLIISCNNKNEHSDQNYGKGTSSINKFIKKKYSSEKVYIFNEEGVTDSVINMICNIEDPYEIINKVDRIYTSGKQLSNQFAFEKIFFKKHFGGEYIQMGAIYPNPDNDYIFEIEWFEIGGGNEVISVFNYKGSISGTRNDQLLVVISKDEWDVYHTDIFLEECGNHYCELDYCFDEDSIFNNYFQDVKCYKDFIKKYPEFEKTENLNMNIFLKP